VTTQDGAVMLPLLGVVAVALLLAVLIADVAGYITAGLQAATAADAAALAAAPQTFRPFGTGATPRVAAARYAAANGAELISCSCAIDGSWRSRVVEVVVARRVDLVLLGRRVVRALGRAELVPTALH
jgi:hypothetical protein